tara:strand:- start:896 stop:1846 length:951 start_codon:yes stop_codon:yes gene_type:complete
MEPKLLDVNVHPSKAEVRFAFQQDVHQFVSRSILEALEKNIQTLVENQPPVDEDIPINTHEEKSFYKSEATCWTGKPEERLTLPQMNLNEGLRKKARGFRLQTPSLPQQVMGFDKTPIPVSNLIYSEFEPLGQLDNSFIIMQGKKGLLVIDQHVAHERILYERFREAAKEKKIEVQNLLFPETIEFSPAETEILVLHIERLKELGMELEAFGKNEFLLRSVPAILKNTDNEKLLRDTIELLPKVGNESILHDNYEDVLIMMSCRNAIKVNHPMNIDQIRKLVSDLEQTSMPFTCPHGRPISLIFEIDDILKKFLRK